jgi:type II secretory pathway pseudopilin PulG
MREAGFTLVETMVATTILGAALILLGQLVLTATRATGDAAALSVATVLAAQKMEQLRALAFSIDASGGATTDTSTDTAVVPESPIGGTGLAPSPPAAPDVNSAGYVDFLDAAGASLGGGAQPAGAAFVRRWSIVALPGNPDNARLLQVVVSRVDRRAAVRLTTVKVRRAR